MHDNTLRLVEDCLPLDLLSERASREKNQHRGNLASLHIWWGRKPQIAARAVLYAALVPAPHDQTQRTAYLNQLIALCTTDMSISMLKQARRQIAEVHCEHWSAAGSAPLIMDLFAGGGAIPLEALRLGCTVLSGDLNPVAYLIELSTLVYPQQYPDLADLVTTWGKRVLNAVAAAVAPFYPLVPSSAGCVDLLALSGAAIPSAYLWTRTVPCPNPHCGATVPLTQHTWLVNRSKQIIALRMVPRPDQKGIDFTLSQAARPEDLDFNPDGLSYRGNARCCCCGATVVSDYVKQQGKARRLGYQLMAVVGRIPGERARFYRAAADLPEACAPDDAHCIAAINALCASSGLSVPDERIFSGDSRAFFTHLYGLERFGDLFTPRQLLVLLTMVQQVRQAHMALLAGGMEVDKARAVTTYLALLTDRLADWNSTLCKWSSTSESISNTFSRQALPMAWNFAELYPLGNGSGNLWDALERMCYTIRILSTIPDTAQVTRGPAHCCTLPDGSVDAVVTDPPYYDMTMCPTPTSPTSSMSGSSAVSAISTRSILLVSSHRRSGKPLPVLRAIRAIVWQLRPSTSRLSSVRWTRRIACSSPLPRWCSSMPTKQRPGGQQWWKPCEQLVLLSLRRGRSALKARGECGHNVRPRWRRVSSSWLANESGWSPGTMPAMCFLT